MKRIVTSFIICSSSLGYSMETKQETKNIVVKKIIFDHIELMSPYNDHDLKEMQRRAYDQVSEKRVRSRGHMDFDTAAKSMSK